MTSHSDIFQIPGTITKVTTMRDNTLRLQIDTQELGDDAPEVLRLINKLGWFVFKLSEVAKEDLNLPEITDDGDKKTPSQRLRDRLYVYYKETHTNMDDWDVWYKKEMNRIGQHYLDLM